MRLDVKEVITDVTSRRVVETDRPLSLSICDVDIASVAVAAMELVGRSEVVVRGKVAMSEVVETLKREPAAHTCPSTNWDNKAKAVEFVEAGPLLPQQLDRTGVTFKVIC